MFGGHLTIDEDKSHGSNPLGEGDEGGLGGVTDGTEHGFTEEAPSEGYTVEAAYETTCLPDLDGMGVSQGVKPTVGLGHLVMNPRPAEALPGGSAARDNPGEMAVEGDLQGGFPEELAHTPGDADLPWEQDTPGVRGPPKDRLLFVVPGEDTHAVGQKETFRCQVTSDGQDALGGGQLGWRENQPVREAKDRHGAGRSVRDRCGGRCRPYRRPQPHARRLQGDRKGPR